MLVSSGYCGLIEFARGVVMKGVSSDREILEGDQSDTVFGEYSAAHCEEVEKLDLDIGVDLSKVFAHDLAPHRAFGQRHQAFEQRFESCVCLFSWRGGRRQRGWRCLGWHDGIVLGGLGVSGGLWKRYTDAEVGQISGWKPKKIKDFFSMRRYFSPICLSELCAVEGAGLIWGA